jgi:hypothetical protein
LIDVKLKPKLKDLELEKIRLKPKTKEPSEHIYKTGQNTKD